MRDGFVTYDELRGPDLDASLWSPARLPLPAGEHVHWTRMRSSRSRTSAGVESPYEDFDDDFTRLRECEITLDRSTSTAAWRVDGHTVYEAHGTLIPERARIGFGIWTMLPIRDGRSRSLEGQGMAARWRDFRYAGLARNAPLTAPLHNCSVRLHRSVLVAQCAVGVVLAGCGFGGSGEIRSVGSWERLPDPPISPREAAMGGGPVGTC